ncbi:MAG: ion transporter [Candidatus Peribacteria bacterium]|jgi:voltage-gated sodium channel|nr:ion transporter [Candidatus Peribacteria bacterium]
MGQLTKFFLNERNVHRIIILNIIVVLIQSFVEIPVLNSLEMLLTFAFFLEITVKMMAKKKQFFKDVWDKMDLILCLLLVIITILIMAESLDTHYLVVLGLRSIRVLRVLRLVRFFKQVGIKLDSFLLGLKASIALLPILLLMIFLFSTLSTVLFQHLSPEYFGNPIRSLITTFHIFIIEGWNEIPEAITGTKEDIWYYLVQMYFLAQLIIGGLMVFPMFLGSINDAMAQDENQEQLNAIRELKNLIEQQGQMLERLCKEKNTGDNSQ